MPQSRAEIRIVDKVLSKLALGYHGPNLIGHKLFPSVTVELSAGPIVKFGKEAFTIVNSERAPGSYTKSVTVGFSSENYSLANHALDAVVPREWLRDKHLLPHINFRRQSVATVLQIEKNNLEFEQASIAQNPNSYSADNKTTLSGSDKWTDYDNSDPQSDVEAAKEAIRKKTGMYPNIMVIPADVHVTLKFHPKLLGQIELPRGQSKTLNVQHYQEIFGVEEVVIGQAALVGRDSDKFEDVWTSSCVLAYVPKQVTSNAEVSYGYTYEYKPPGEPAHPNVEEFYWHKDTKSWKAGVEYERQAIMTGMDAGYLIQGCK